MTVKCSDIMVIFKLLYANIAINLLIHKRLTIKYRPKFMFENTVL